MDQVHPTRWLWQVSCQLVPLRKVFVKLEDCCPVLISLFITNLRLGDTGSNEVTLEAQIFPIDHRLPTAAGSENKNNQLHDIIDTSQKIPDPQMSFPGVNKSTDRNLLEPATEVTSTHDPPEGRHFVVIQKWVRIVPPSRNNGSLRHGRHLSPAGNLPPRPAVNRAERPVDRA